MINVAEAQVKERKELRQVFRFRSLAFQACRKPSLILPPDPPSFMMPRMSLTVLVDNNTLIDRYFLAEPGLSFLIQTGGKKILFDAGYSDAFLSNAMKMGINLRDLDFIVLSHGHLDHTWGLVPLVRLLTEATIEAVPHTIPELVAHPLCFSPKEKLPLPNIGSILTEAEARRQFRVHLSAEPVWITDDLVFLGEIPRRFPFEEGDPGKRRILLPNGKKEPDLLLDDSALAFRSDKGLVIITGCSHAGICNITEHAREVCDSRTIAGIIGGLHLVTPSAAQLRGTGEYLHQLRLLSLYPCHCTTLVSRIALAEYCPVQEVGAGMKLEW